MSSHLERQGIKSTRFIGATIIWLTGTVGWLGFVDKMSAGEWWIMSLGVLAIYAASEASAKRSVAEVIKVKMANKEVKKDAN